MAGLTERENQAVNDLVQRLRRRLGEELIEIRLYGSKSRRSDSPESDVDLAIVVRTQTLAVRHCIFEEVSNVILEHDVLLDVHIVDERHLQELRSLGAPYAKRLDEEGVKL